MSASIGLILVLLSWGAFAFGAVYPWAFIPLAIGCGALGLWKVIEPGPRSVEIPLLLAFLAIIIAIGAQLIPLPSAMLARLNPETDLALREIDLAYSTVRPAAFHALSIRPSDTWMGLALTFSLGVFMLGLARALSGDDVRRLTQGIALLGVAMALSGIVQGAMTNGKIYGFWQPLYAGRPFGPFINRNHFAGWMLMALPLVVGLFCASSRRAMRSMQSGLRNRLLWLSSHEANQVGLVAFAILIMGLSLVMTFSRSGITVFVAALIVVGLWMMGRRSGRWHRLVAAAYIAFVPIIVIAWAGADAVAARFIVDGHGPRFDGRLVAWQDALSIARRFPLTGTGLNTYGTATLLYQSPQLPAHYVEAHNDYLQLAAEGGLLVGLPALALLVLFIWIVRQRFRQSAKDSTSYWLRVGAVIGLATVALQEAGDFSLQMPGNAALFATLCAIALHRSEDACSQGLAGPTG